MKVYKRTVPEHHLCYEEYVICKYCNSELFIEEEDVEIEPDQCSNSTVKNCYYKCPICRYKNILSENSEFIKYVKDMINI